MAHRFPYKIIVGRNTGTGLKILSGADVRFYVSGTDTAKAAYASESSAALTQPIKTDVRGEVEVYLEPGRFRVEATYLNLPVETFEDFIPDGSMESANGAGLQFAIAETTIPSLVGATGTAVGAIPAGSWVLGVTCRVITAITGATDFQVGTIADPDAWGAAVDIILGATNSSEDFTIATLPFYAAATDIVVTANGGAFVSGGVRLAIQYITVTPPTQ